MSYASISNRDSAPSVPEAPDARLLAAAIQERTQREAWSRIQVDPLYWLRRWTKTYDQHWKEKGLDGPNSPFPDLPYFEPIYEVWKHEPRLWICKSRTMMASWFVVGIYAHMCMTQPGQEVLFQSEKEEKAIENGVNYARALWLNQPTWLREKFPLERPLHLQPEKQIAWANGSRFIGIPEGGNQFRSYHPTAVIEDEAAFQALFADAYQAALPASRKVTVISTPFPGAFNDVVAPPQETQGLELAQGLTLRYTAAGMPVLYLHYTADPKKTPEWARGEKKQFLDPTVWSREMELDCGASGGELMLRDIYDEHRDGIEIVDPGFQPSIYWQFFGGLDWGRANPTSFNVYGMDEDGILYALSEHYRRGLAPRQHMPHMMAMPKWGQLRATYADPRVFDNSEAQSDGSYRAIADMFIEAGFPREKLLAGNRKKGGDLQFIERLRDWFTQPHPRLRILCPGSMRLWESSKEGTYSYGCPNLIWELRRLRRVNLSARQQLTQNQPEGIVQKDNHAFDALKYLAMSEPAIETPGLEQKWRGKVKDLIDRGVQPDPNALRFAYLNYLKTQAPKGIRWR